MWIFLLNCNFKLEEIRDDYERTPLHDAFWTSKASPKVIDFLLHQKNIVQLLLLKDKRGNTPLDYSRLEDHNTWIQFLKERKELLCINTNINNDVNDESTATAATATATDVAVQLSVSESEQQQQQHQQQQSNNNNNNNNNKRPRTT